MLNLLKILVRPIHPLEEQRFQKLMQAHHSYDYSKNTRFDIGYKFGPLLGYGDDLINVAGISVFAGAFLDVSWKRAGLDIGLIPAGIITANFRIDIDNMKLLGSF